MMKRLGVAITCLVFLCPLSACSALQGNHKLKSAVDKLGWKLGCQAYTFRKLSLLETIDTLHGLGIRYVEMYPGQRFSPDKKDVKADHNMSAELIDELLAKCKSADVTPVSYGVVDLPNDEAKARKVFDFARKMGMETIVSEPTPESFDLLDRLAGEYKINVAIHNHPAPSRYWNCDTVAQVCVGRSTRIGACADDGHWYRSGLVPVECAKKLEGRIIEFHFKDISDAKGDVPWGTGKCDVPALLAEIKRQKFKGLFSIEYESTEGAELIENVRKCVAFFNQQAELLAK